MLLLARNAFEKLLVLFQNFQISVANFVLSAYCFHITMQSFMVEVLIAMINLNNLYRWELGECIHNLFITYDAMFSNKVVKTSKIYSYLL